MTVFLKIKQGEQVNKLAQKKYIIKIILVAVMNNLNAVSNSSSSMMFALKQLVNSLLRE